MAPETFAFDAAAGLDDELSQAEYLSDALATNDDGLFLYALGVVSRARGMTEVARNAGVQREHLYRALSDTGHPEMATVMKVVRALGLQLAVVPASAAR